MSCIPRLSRSAHGTDHALVLVEGTNNGQFPLRDAPARSHFSCIRHVGLDICFVEYNYHDSLQVCHREGIAINNITYNPSNISFVRDWSKHVM